MKSIREIQVCKDPLTKIFFGKFRYKVVYFWFIIHIILILTSVYYGTLTNISLPFKSSVENVKVVPLFKDINFYLFLILGTCGIILVNYFLESILKTFVELWENDVI